MIPRTATRLRIAAIDFLNPAPLMWDFEHSPLQDELATRYCVERMTPARCAEQLLAGHADLGLIPIAELTSELAIIPGCVIASLDRVRSIQLIVKLRPTYGDLNLNGTSDRALRQVRTIAADSASRSSLAYAQVLFRRFIGVDPAIQTVPADPRAMLALADAALLIGDAALLALEQRSQIEMACGPCLWLDLAHEWVVRTGLPWVAAVWAARPSALPAGSAGQVVADLERSRDHGLANVDRIVQDWTGRIAVAPAVIREYLTHNIHYFLTDPCVRTIRTFREFAAEDRVLPPLPSLKFLGVDHPAER